MFEKVWSAIERVVARHKRIALTLGVLFGAAVMVVFSSTASPPSTVGGNTSETSSCEAVWQKHVDNANSYSYPAGDHDAFVSQCESGDSAVSSAVN